MKKTGFFALPGLCRPKTRTKPTAMAEIRCHCREEGTKKSRPLSRARYKEIDAIVENKDETHKGRNVGSVWHSSEGRSDAIEIFQSEKSERYYFRLKAGNGEIIIESVASNAPDAKFVDLID